QPARKTEPAFVGLEHRMGDLGAFEHHTASPQGLDQKAGTVLPKDLKLSSIPLLPALIEVDHHGDHTVVAPFKLIQVLAVMASGRIVCQVELLPGNAQIAIAIEMEDTPVHHDPKILEPCIPSPVQPIGEIPTDLAVDLFVGTDTGLIEIGEHPQKE